MQTRGNPERQISGRPLVLDNDSWLSSNGYSGESKPRSVFKTFIGYNPQLIGYPKYPANIADVEHYTREYYIGEEALQLRGVLKLVYPITHGQITDWPAMEKIWHYTFHNALSVNPTEHPVLLTEGPLNPAHNREKMGEIMFETFNVPAFHTSSRPVLTLYASGRTTGLVVDSTLDVTSIVPVYEGFSIDHAITRIDIGDRDVTEYLRRLLHDQGLSLAPSTSVEREIASAIKEKLCYVALDPEREIALAKLPPRKMAELRKRIKQSSLEIAEYIMGQEATADSPRSQVQERLLELVSSELRSQISPTWYKARKEYILPDGSPITLGLEQFRAPEVIFNPRIIGKGTKSLDEAVIETIEKCDADFHSDLYNNIVLSGKATTFPGFKERLYAQILDSVSEEVQVNVFAPPTGIYSAWVGGSIISSLKTFQKEWLTQEKYQKDGLGANI